VGAHRTAEAARRVLATAVVALEAVSIPITWFFVFPCVVMGSGWRMRALLFVVAEAAEQRVWSTLLLSCEAPSQARCQSCQAALLVIDYNTLLLRLRKALTVGSEKLGCGFDLATFCSKSRTCRLKTGQLTCLTECSVMDGC